MTLCFRAGKVARRADASGSLGLGGPRFLRHASNRLTDQEVVEYKNGTMICSDAITIELDADLSPRRMPRRNLLLILSLGTALALAPAVMAGESSALVQSFPAGNSPEGLAFDGNSIWAVNGPDSAVTKLRARDGFIEGVFPVGREPHYLVFDGTNIWAANAGDGTVTELRASDGTFLASYHAGVSPFGAPSTAQTSG